MTYGGPAQQPGAWPGNASGPIPMRKAFPTRRVVAIVVITVVVLALAGGLLWQVHPWAITPVSPSPSGPASAQTPSPAPSPSGPVTPATLPVTLTAGGGIGRPVPYATKAGAGTVLVTKATWTRTGAMPPDAGMMYLIVDVEFTGTAGRLQAGESTVLVQDATGTRHLAAYGPGDTGTPDRVLTPGTKVTGQIGFQLPAGEATLIIVDERMLDVATVGIPAP